MVSVLLYVVSGKAVCDAVVNAKHSKISFRGVGLLMHKKCAEYYGNIFYKYSKNVL